MSASSQSPVALLSPLDAAIWHAAEREIAPGQEWALLRAAVGDTRSTLTVWVLLENEQTAFSEGIDRLGRVHGITDARWLGGGKVFLVTYGGEPFVFAILPSTRDGIVSLVTSITATDDRWKRLRRWVVRGASALAPVYLNEGDFIAIGDRLAEHAPVSASRLTARDLADGSSLSRGWPEQRRRSRPSHREALTEAQNMAVRTLTLHVGERLLMQVRREAGATFYSGDFDLFERVVIGSLEDAAGRRRQLLSGRERRREGSARPILVRTHGATFDDPDAVRDLVDVLERQDSTSVAVFHRNPYLHAAVTDYSDGSNFDLFVNQADEVVVIPGYRASLTSLARLTDTVGERFAAVEVAEAARVRPTLEDLLDG